MDPHSLGDLELLYERLADAVSSADDPAAALAALSPAHRALVVLPYVSAVIANGGFAALFYNPTGDVWQEALAAAELIGAERHAVLLRRVGELCPGGKLPGDLEQREEILESIADGVLAELDEEWFAARPVEEHLRAYAEAHAMEFE